MKNLAILLSILSFYSVGAMSMTVAEVEMEFKERTMDTYGLEKVLEVGKSAEAIFNQDKLSDAVRARAVLVACRAKNYWAEYYPAPRAEKKVVFYEGSVLCKKGIALLEKELGIPKKAKDAKLLADLYFWYVNNFGRWFEDEKKGAALKYWKKDIKPKLNTLIEVMNMQDMYGWGPVRALGRAYYSIPAGKKKSLRYMKKAYMKSRSRTHRVSIYPLNTVYYAESLIARNKDEEARKVLNATIKLAENEQKLRDLNQEAERLYNDYRWTETLHEVDMCRNLLNSIL